MGNTCLPNGSKSHETSGDSSPLHDIQAVIRRFECLYDYYKERLDAEKSKAVKIAQQDSVRAQVHLGTCKRYEHALEVTAGFLKRLNEVLIDLQVVQNTAESMQVLDRYGRLMHDMLEKIHRETNVTRVLERIERDVERLEMVNKELQRNSPVAEEVVVAVGGGANNAHVTLSNDDADVRVVLLDA